MSSLIYSKCGRYLSGYTKCNKPT